MCIVIAGGKSVTDYDGHDLAQMCFKSFTFGVNDSGFLWPCDVVVALDPDWIVHNLQDLKEMGKPVITREWEVLQGKGLDLIELPNDIPWRLSGMVACKLADELAKDCGCNSYVFGMDATKGHYFNDKGDCSDIVPLDGYDALKLSKTFNMGVRSRIKAWPKLSKLPHIKKVLHSKPFKELAISWLRVKAREKIA